MVASGSNANLFPASPASSASRITNSIAGATLGSLTSPIAAPVIGIDVGEDFLDIAVLDSAAKTLRLARVTVIGIESEIDRCHGGLMKDGIANEGIVRAEIANDRVARAGIVDGSGRASEGATPAGIVDNGERARIIGEAGVAIPELQRRLLAVAPELDAKGAVVLIDSPRWPRNLPPRWPREPDPATAAVDDHGPVMRGAGSDLQRGSDDLRHGPARPSTGRAIDTVLRAIVRGLALKKRGGAPYRLALFPTPEVEFFAACARDPRCKPHLAAIACELFGPALSRKVFGLTPAGAAGHAEGNTSVGGPPLKGFQRCRRPPAVTSSRASCSPVLPPIKR
jgi:hypothetical protein